MTAPYVPQVGDRVRKPWWKPNVWLDVEWSNADDESTFLAGHDERGNPFADHAPSEDWVKVDKPEPWPRHFLVISRHENGPSWEFGSPSKDAAVESAYAWIGRGMKPSDVHIWRLNPDGSVTVLDHTGSELA